MSENTEEVSIWQKATRRAFNGGAAGATAMATQVGSLMWMRTIMNYQYRHGGTTTAVMKKLFKQGGIPRFYRGLGPALIQGPLSRFGDTAANTGVLELLNSYDETKNLSIGSKTLIASGAASAYRVGLMPVDAVKTSMQVNGNKGVSNLINKVRIGGPKVLFHGAGATVSASWVGYYPWFFTYNYMNSVLPEYEETHKKLGRNALIGFSASIASDSISNTLRVIKTKKQTYKTPISYADAAKGVIKKDGIVGLMGRGLKTRIMCNGLQGMIFAVAWKYLMEVFDNET